MVLPQYSATRNFRSTGKGTLENENPKSQSTDYKHARLTIPWQSFRHFKKRIVLDEAEIEVLSARPTRPKRAAALRARPSSPPQPSGSSAQPSTTEVGGPKATMLLFRDLLGDEHFLGPAFVTATLDFLRDLVGMHQEEVHRRLATWYPVIETHLSKTRKHPDRLFIRRSTR